MCARSSSAACLDERRVCRVADQAMWSVFHQLHIFEGLGELPQRPALHERPLAEAVIVPPEAALQYPAAEAAPLPLMPEDQLREQVRLTDQMVINAAMAEQAAQEAAQRAAVAQRKVWRGRRRKRRRRRSRSGRVGAQRASRPKPPGCGFCRPWHLP